MYLFLNDSAVVQLYLRDNKKFEVLVVADLRCVYLAQIRLDSF